jgi:hypothetical protein
MPAQLSCICIDSINPHPLAEFWSAVLGWDIIEEDDEGVSLAPPEGGPPTLDILQVPETKSGKNRLHLDLRPDNTTFEVELDRLEHLGAVRVNVGQHPDVTWQVLADPEGNEFCLLRKTVQEISALHAL